MLRISAPTVFQARSTSVFFQVMFWEGEARGPARLRKPDGSVEERQYSNGSKEGPATLRLPNGDTIEYSYRADEIEGESTYTWANGSTETSVYVKGVKVLGATGDCSTIHLTNIDWKKRESILLHRKGKLKKKHFALFTDTKKS